MHLEFSVCAFCCICFQLLRCFFYSSTQFIPLFALSIIKGLNWNSLFVKFVPHAIWTSNLLRNCLSICCYKKKKWCQQTKHVISWCSAFACIRARMNREGDHGTGLPDYFGTRMYICIILYSIIIKNERI